MSSPNRIAHLPDGATAAHAADCQPGDRVAWWNPLRRDWSPPVTLREVRVLQPDRSAVQIFWEPAEPNSHLLLTGDGLNVARWAAAEYPRLTVSPDGYGDPTVWLVRHLGDTKPQPWISRPDLPALDGAQADALWDRLIASLPCTPVAYQQATDAIGPEPRHLDAEAAGGYGPARCTTCGGLLPASEARAGYTTHERCHLLAEVADDTAEAGQ